MNIRDSLHFILQQWPTESKQEFKANKLAQFIRNEFPKTIRKFTPENHLIKASAGAGNWADVPWLSILNPEITKSTEKGYYPVYLFRPDGSGVFLSFGFGVTEIKQLHGKKAEEVTRFFSDDIRRNYFPSKGWDSGALDLKARTTLGRSYGKASAGFKFYSFDSLPSNEVLEQDLLEMMAIYAKSFDYLPNLHPSFQSPSVTLTSAKKIPQLYSSLLSKPFTILTGASGTGKTQVAKSLAKYYSDDYDNPTNSAIVAVGADWTDNRNTLGFVNHLNKDKNAQPIYQSSEILNLVLRADAKPDFPHFLILDEMNLSHVERYFADFLSVMEQRDGQFHLHDEGSQLTNSASGQEPVPSRLPYPQNLFVIGTVNIDETTYMFSPKVLDRANVIEFKVDRDDLSDFLDDPQEPTEVEQAETGQAEAFLLKAKEARSGGLASLDAAVSEGLNKHLLDLFDIMQAGRFEFAYRSANEITRYMRVCQDLAEDKDTWKKSDWETNFDEQIVQKILPKLHGSIGRMGKLIATLAHFCHAPEKEPKDALQEVIDELKPEEAKYKKSFAKLQSMAATLREEQFVSFIH